ncbi:fungal-specific transcription factor domain-containing protein [Thelonectria olida]|uniref:Fungal-specific transcription factor domain-containing protein n=1 Tax=Thelonectria olida TaxID=1576542 RepID=A0A9P8VT32_9HYPO|nr:fungal-specific transcription factor domain-containing protein [Thelonectria olida]
MGQAKVEKRNRPPVSCEPCRTRKLKCNRGLPCDTCIKRGKRTTCHYAPNADRNVNKRASVSDRLKNIEGLIASLIPNVPHTSTSPVLGAPMDELSIASSGLIQNSRDGTGDAPIPAPTTSSSSPSQAEANQTSYVDSTHWSSILKDIRDIREQLGEHGPIQPHGTSPPAHASKEPDHGSFDLGFGHCPVSTLQEIVASLPPRSVSDSLVFHYFNSRFTILPILHPNKFQLEYERFWENPLETSVIWIGLLFAVLSLAAGLCQISDMSNRPRGPIPTPRDLSEMAKRCFVLGHYAEAKEYGLEALLVYLQTCYLRTKDTDVSFWFLMGVIIRLAIRMGYHRDPTKLPGCSELSPFESEMRRRVWWSIYQVDALISFQMGLPSMIPSAYCDTELPSNIEYSDFGPDSLVLPPQRPDSDHTVVLYTIAKNPVVDMFKKAVAHTQRLEMPPLEETMSLDGALREAYNNVPEVLRYRPIKRSFIDGPAVIMRRTTIEILNLKSIIILHRQHLVHQQDPKYARSRHACLEAALQVLSRQAELHLSTQPGGQLHDDRWMISALTTNDFILAAMVTCLDVTLRIQYSLRGSRVPDVTKAERQTEGAEIEAIKAAQKIWESAESYSSEARIASRALESTIRKWNDHQNLSRLPAVAGNAATTTMYNYAEIQHDGCHVEQIAGLGDGSEFIDWALIDHYCSDAGEQAADLESWILEAAGWFDSVDSSGFTSYGLES